jgi:hypothetical protein
MEDMVLKLLTKALEKRFAKVGRQENIKDPLVICKFFYPAGRATWYATEYYPEERRFFGYGIIHEGEWGYFSLDEFQNFKGKFGLRIERDLGFKETPWSKVEEYLKKEKIL